jgi:hypothetical protein
MIDLKDVCSHVSLFGPNQAEDQTILHAAFLSYDGVSFHFILDAYQFNFQCIG